MILATGAVPRKLGIPGEAEFTGRGVSWCATCDGALYREKVVCVIGGGDAAVEEAMFLTKFASQGPPHPPPRRAARHQVHPGALLREPEDRGAPRAAYRSRSSARTARCRGIRLESTKGEPEEVLPVAGRLHLRRRASGERTRARAWSNLSDNGYIKIDHDGRTSVPGLFAAGDVTDSELKQVITAAAKGASAAFEALRYIDEDDHLLASRPGSIERRTRWQT